ncbi:hypothetical protein [Amycolatopsis sp. NPDC004079]|uniref:hypothetical protein n=1 Tax=Amycolatopsis sp. NPDC004079 TaxID=3154549 RepID=UPI0033A3D447
MKTSPDGVRPIVVGGVEALAKGAKQIKRLFGVVHSQLEDSTAAPPPRKALRTARQLRPAEIDELVVKFRNGATIRELAKEFGIYRVTVGQHLRSRGVDTRNLALKSDDVTAAAKLYLAGWSIGQLAERYKVGNETVRGRLIAAGVKLRRRGRTPKISQPNDRLNATNLPCVQR